jgi:integrase
MPSRLIQNTSTVDFTKDPIIKDFLDSQKKSTRNTYSAYMRRLGEFTSESGEQILRNGNQWLKKIFVFQQWLIEKGYAETYAQSATGMLRGFFGYHRKPLIFTRTECKRLAERSRSTEDYLFDREDISKMAMCGNLKERYVLLVGKSLGLRAGDFVNLTYGKFRSLKLDSEPPIFIGVVTTQKERVPAYPFLDSDAVPIVRQILDLNQNKPDSEYILMTKSKKAHNTYMRMRDEELSIILQSLARKANIQNGSKRVRFHCLRKYLSDRLSSLMSESKWKQVIGKQINEGAYINADSLQKDYLRVMPTTIISNGNGKVKQELEATKTTVETLSQTIAEQATRISEMEDRFEQKLSEKVKLLIDTINAFQKEK